MNRYFKSSEFIVIHLIVAIITVACLMMSGPMREGLPVGGDLALRLGYISEHLFLWRLGWVSWMFSALGLFLFCVFLAEALRPSVFRTFGLGLVAIGIGPDLMAELIYAFVIPEFYSKGLDLSVLALLEQLAIYLTGFLGNGLYNLGGLTLNFLLIREGLVPRWVGLSGLVAWLLGIGLSISVLLNDIEAAELLTALSMVLSTAWMLLIAYQLFGKKHV